MNLGSDGTTVIFACFKNRDERDRAVHDTNTQRFFSSDTVIVS